MPNTQQCFLGFLLLNVTILTSCCNKIQQQKSNLRNYQVKVLPDSVVFGKNQEVVLAIKNLKADDVKNISENDTSIEITYDVEVTNKNKITTEPVFIDLSKFRLLLNNQKKITHAFYNSMGTDPQSTTISTGNIFNLPAKTKPIALDLFFADSIARVKVLLK